jgi:hypothetical protein
MSPAACGAIEADAFQVGDETAQEQLAAAFDGIAADGRLTAALQLPAHRPFGAHAARR